MSAKCYKSIFLNFCQEKPLYRIYVFLEKQQMTYLPVIFAIYYYGTFNR